jgi:hypothetical protein
LTEVEHTLLWASAAIRALPSLRAKLCRPAALFGNPA